MLSVTYIKKEICFSHIRQHIISEACCFYDIIEHYGTCPSTLVCRLNDWCWVKFAQSWVKGITDSCRYNKVYIHMYNLKNKKFILLYKIDITQIILIHWKNGFTEV